MSIQNKRKIYQINPLTSAAIKFPPKIVSIKSPLKFFLDKLNSNSEIISPNFPYLPTKFSVFQPKLKIKEKFKDYKPLFHKKSNSLLPPRLNRKLEPKPLGWERLNNEMNSSFGV
jgi:hypothetical protein